MKKIYHIELDEFDFNQTLDGLEQRAEAWKKTARYHRTGELSDDILVEQCRDAEEAEQIALHYRSIIRSFNSAVSKNTSRINI
jgi:hypothetical protein